jgi:surfactin synthase thioesterase subunit
MQSMQPALFKVLRLCAHRMGSWGIQIGDAAPTVKSLTPWKLQTTAEYKTQLFSGDHFFIQSVKAEFLGILRQDLLQALSV